MKIEAVTEGTGERIYHMAITEYELRMLEWAVAPHADPAEEIFRKSELIYLHQDLTNAIGPEAE